MTCGHIKPVTGANTLVCEREAGHDGRHATLNRGAAVAQWDDAPHVITSETWMSPERAQWRKPHKRKPTR